MPTRLLFPDLLHELLKKRYQRQCHHWLADAGNWPLSIALGSPNETQASQELDVIKIWIKVWQTWQGAGETIWRERQWRTLGVQRLPERILFHTPLALATYIGEKTRWQQASQRYVELTRRWPTLTASLAKYFDVLADYPDDDLQHLISVLNWLEKNPHSNLYIRQLPIAGLDSKWLETRKGLITNLWLALQEKLFEEGEGKDFFTACHLKPSPTLIRFRVLDPHLRRYFSGLSDVTAPLTEIATLNLPLKKLFIVENLQTGLAFPDIPNAIVLMGLGYAVDVLAQLPWMLRAKKIFYWGDIDTHGFAILNRARVYCPQMQTILMDEETLLRHPLLWGSEKKQHAAVELNNLTSAEQTLYQQLKQQRWGKNIRLEQERIEWSYVLSSLDWRESLFQ